MGNVMTFIFYNIFCSFYGSMLEFINSLTLQEIWKAEVKKALVFEPQHIDRCIDVSYIPASNPFSWFFALPVKNILSTTTNCMTSIFWEL